MIHWLLCVGLVSSELTPADDSLVQERKLSEENVDQSEPDKTESEEIIHGVHLFICWSDIPDLE